MRNINNPIAGLELAQIGWVVPDIHAAVEFLANALGIAGATKIAALNSGGFVGVVATIPNRKSFERAGFNWFS